MARLCLIMSASWRALPRRCPAKAQAALSSVIFRPRRAGTLGSQGLRNMISMRLWSRYSVSIRVPTKAARSSASRSGTTATACEPTVKEEAVVTSVAVDDDDVPSDDGDDDVTDSNKQTTSSQARRTACFPAMNLRDRS